MAYIEWPGTIPYQTFRDGWGCKPFRDPIETEMEAGNVRVRPRTDGNVAVVKWGREMNQAEVDAFIEFTRDTLSLGTARFLMPVSINGVTYEARVVQIVANSTQLVAVSPFITMVTLDLLVFLTIATS
ncbi:hypothetical protein [Xanthobacter autotrophicus]|uniref:hypothetical protein n=1 Tax=Xanthobacter autotrophicus TaxID=280 RepID=UPI00372C7118